MSESSKSVQDREPFDAELAAVLREQDALSHEAIKPWLADMRDRLAKERGARAFLSSRPNWVRVIAGLALVIALAAFAALLAGPEAVASGLGGKLVAFGLLAAVLLYVGLRPLYRRALPEWVRRGTLLLAVLVPSAFAFAGGSGGKLGFFAQLPGAVPCFAKGSLMALPLVLLVSLLHRGGRASTTVFLAAGAGVGGNMLLESGCNGGAAVHVMFGHVGIIIAYAAVAFGAIQLLRCLRSS